MRAQCGSSTAFMAVRPAPAGVLSRPITGFCSKIFVKNIWWGDVLRDEGGWFGSCSAQEKMPCGHSRRLESLDRAGNRLACAIER